MNKKIIIIGSVFALTSIILGAFGAHALNDILSSERIASFKTGTQYQMFHALALITIGFNAKKLPNIRLLSFLFIAGIICFSFSIYLLSLQSLMQMNLSSIGFVTPLGGLLLIGAWISFISSVVKQK
jgi:uncharacterized membrane protein YgdD (TMEM256/DUF423 family)